jgi:5-methylcytosine-specific restriction endonuclease McrA
LPRTFCIECGRPSTGSRCDEHQIRRTLSPAMKRRIKRRDGWRCTECGSTVDLEVHHRIPLADGGTDRRSNLVTLCATCHLLKRDR